MRSGGREADVIASYLPINTPIFRRLDNSENFSEASTPPRQIYIVDLPVYALLERSILLKLKPYSFVYLTSLIYLLYNRN